MRLGASATILGFGPKPSSTRKLPTAVGSVPLPPRCSSLNAFGLEPCGSPGRFNFKLSIKIRILAQHRELEPVIARDCRERAHDGRYTMVQVFVTALNLRLRRTSCPGRGRLSAFVAVLGWTVRPLFNARRTNGVGRGDPRRLIKIAELNGIRSARLKR